MEVETRMAFEGPRPMVPIVGTIGEGQAVTMTRPPGWRAPASDFRMAPSLRAHTVATFERCCWVLHVACARCRKGVAFRPGELAARFAPDVTAGAILDRMVCSCGSREGGAMILQAREELQIRDLERCRREDGEA